MTDTKKPRTEVSSTSDDDAAMKIRMRQDWPVLPADAMSDPTKLSTILYSHDIPHDSSNLEWWYVNGHFGPEKRFSVFAAFFRLKVETSSSPRAYALNWAVTDTLTGKYHRFGYVQHDAPEIVTKLMQKGEYNGDPHVLQALKDLFAAGKVPVPDQILPPNSVTESSSAVAIQVGKSFFKRCGGDYDAPLPTYELFLEGTTNENEQSVPETSISLRLYITPKAGAVLHGKNGIVSVGSWHHDMFYYFSPICSLSTATSDRKSTISINEVQVDLSSSSSSFWIDHEFGGTYPITSAEEERLKVLESSGTQGLDHSWQWAALHLANGDALSVTLLVDSKTQKVVDQFAIHQSCGTGKFQRYDDVALKSLPNSNWKSQATGMTFPTGWDVAVPGIGLQLQLVASVKEQEFISLGGKPSYWEGRVSCSGTLDQSPIQGLGFLECHVKQDGVALATAFEMMHMMLCMPLQMNPLAAGGTTAANAETIAATTAVPIVEQTAMMLAMAGEKPLLAGHKDLLRALLGAFAVVWHRPVAEAAAALQWAELQWQQVLQRLPSDYRLIVLRAFMRRALEKAVTAKCPQLLQAAAAAATAAATSAAVPTATPAAVAVQSSSRRHQRPTESQFTSAAASTDFSAFSKKITGTWLYDKPRNVDSIADFLGAQGVGIAARMMCAAVTPTLKIKTTPQPSVETEIVTAVSSTTMKVLLSGQSWTWNSFGRGEVSARACLVSPDTICVETTLPADHSVEFKWLTVGDDELAEVMEHYKDKNSASAPIATFRQFFKRSA